MLVFWAERMELHHRESPLGDSNLSLFVSAAETIGATIGLL